MTFLKFFLLIIVAAFALASLPGAALASASDPARRVALDSAKAQAAELLSRGEADEACSLYLRLQREIPEDDEVILGLARAAARASRFNLAVISYEMLLEKHPREAGLYGELAHVYMLLGDRQGAERSAAMMRSLEGSAPEDTALALDILQERYNLWQIHGALRTGIIYDSNANLGPDSDLMELGSWRVQVDNAGEKASWGIYLGGEVDLARRFYRDSPWYVVGDVRAFWRGHERSSLADLHSQELQWGRGAVGLRHLTSKTLSEIRFKGEIFDYEFYQNVSALGPEATLLWAVRPNFHLISKASVEQRIYSRDSDRNGPYAWLGQYARFFFGADNHEFILGGRLLGAWAGKNDYSYLGWEASLRFVFKLPYGFEFSPFATYGQEDYSGPATVLESDNRRDNRLRLGAGLVYRINEAWALELTYQYSENDCNSELYEYEQHYISSGVAWNF
jgi:hypothetical protein